MRVGCVIATGIGGHRARVETQHDVMRDRGAKMVSPLGIPLYMPNAGAAAVSMRHGLRGQSYGVVSACAGGAHAIGSALRMIQYGDADAVVCRRRRGDADARSASRASTRCRRCRRPASRGRSTPAATAS